MRWIALHAEGYLFAGDVQKALETYGRAINAGHGSARDGKGWSLSVLGYDEAVDYLALAPKAVALSRSRRILKSSKNHL
jgi:hypothetical protein